MMAGRTIPVSALAPGSRSAISIVCRFFKACGRGVHSYTFYDVFNGLLCLPVFDTGKCGCLS